LKFTTITGNGEFSLTITGVTSSSEVTVYAPSAMLSTVSIGYRDATNTFVSYTDGQLVAGDQKRVRCGRGVDLRVLISGFTNQFDIGYAS